MPRRVQDIIPSNRRSIRDIPTVTVPTRASRSEDYQKTQKKEKYTEKGESIKIHKEHVEKHAEHVPIETKQKKRRSRSFAPIILSVFGCIVIIAGIAFMMSSHFASATFTLAPRVLSVAVNSTYTIPSARPGVFGYEIISMTSTASTTIAATQGSYTETKSQGTVVIYNAYSQSSQRIVAGTHLSNDSGLVYRLMNSVVVPGYTGSGSTILPGSITTSIIADVVGQQYNISRSDSLSDFKIISYKGTPKYSGFYARLTGDMTGGFAGVRTVIAPTLLASTTALLQNKLITSLQNSLLSTVPEGYVMYPRAYSSIFTKPVVTPQDSTTAHLNISATLFGIIFKKIDFAQFLSGASSTATFGTLGYSTSGIESLSFVFSNQKEFSPAKKSDVIARVNGSLVLVGAIPMNTLKQELTGVSLSHTADILKKYSFVIDIAHSGAEITPPWISSVPKDIRQITINLK